MRVLRSSLFVAATAIIAAACGDKVTVPQTTTTPAKINSVTVAPSTATINVGQSVSLTAAINADAGLTTTTTWTTSSAAAATVSATGTVLGVAASPGVAICASVTAAGANTVSACASVVVAAVANPVPATVQITSVTTVNLNTPAAVPPGVVAGQINVSVTANPGTEHLDSVVVFINGVSAGTQTLTAAQAAALRAAADAAIADQQVVAPIVFSINTAAYNTTTGVPTFLNGNMVISAVAYGHQGSAAAQNAASQSVSYVLGNVDGFQVTLVNNGAKAVDATGFAWWGNGTVTVNALPVMYSGKTVGSVTASLGSGATGGTCNVGVGAAVTSTAAVAGVWSEILPLTLVQSAAACSTTNPNFPLINATDSNGNVLVLGGITNFGGTATGSLNAQTGVRIDNVPPPTAGLIANLAVNGRTGNWINDVVSLNSVTSPTNLNGAIAAGVVDAGVGAAGGAGTGVNYVVKVGTTFTLAKTAPGLANTSSLAMLATNASYCAIAYTSDALGNTSVSPGTGSTCALPVAASGYVLPAAGIGSVQFGVDRIAPLISYSGGLAANALVATATLATEFSVTVSDTGLVGNSGMAPATPVIMQVSQRAAAGNGPGTTTCLNANNTTATTCGVLSATGVNAAGNPIYTTSMAALTANAYLTFTATATDAAGNSTTIAPRIVAHDAGPLLVGAVSAPITVAASGYSASAFINDGLDIGSFSFSGDYPVAAGFAVGPSVNPNRFAQAVTAVDGFNAASFLNTNYAVTGPMNLPLALQQGGVLYAMSGIEANATNVVGTIVTGAAVAPPAVAPALVVFAPTGLATFPAITNSIASNNISSGVTTAATAGNPATGTLTVTATGPTATFNNPFSRVDFYAANLGGALGTQQILIGSTNVSALVDVGAVRTFSWTLPISGATLYTQLGFVATATTQVIAIGYNANGTIGMLNAAVYTLNIIK